MRIKRNKRKREGKKEITGENVKRKNETTTN